MLFIELFLIVGDFIARSLLHDNYKFIAGER